MKKNLLLIMLLLGCSMFICSMAKNKVVKITGTINSYGNVPFNFPGIVTEDGKKYTVIAEPEVKKELMQLGGTLIVFKGVIIDDEELVYERLEDGFFEVHSYKVKKSK